MFERKGYSWYNNQYNYSLTDHTLVPALWYTLEERKDLVDVFTSKMHLTVGVQYAPLRQAVFQLVNSNYTTCSNALYLKEDDAKYFAPVCMVRQFKPLFDCMPRDVFESFFIRMISDLIENDLIVDIPYLESLITGNRGLTLPQQLKLKGYQELYAYIAFGKIPQHEIKANDYAGLTMAAIHRVIEGKYAEAVKVFGLAMKVHNKTTSMKNMYMVSLLNYYLMVAYSHDGSTDSRTKTKQFLNKSSVSEYISLVPSRIVAEQFLSTNKNWHKEGVRNLFIRMEMQTVPRTLGCLAYLLDMYFELKALDSDSPNATKPKPRLALLRHELSEYLDLTDKERSELKSLFGERAGLTAVKHKAEWELSLERLMKGRHRGREQIRGEDNTSDVCDAQQSKFQR